MGLLTEGVCTPLSWKETKKHADFVKKQGIRQFINMYHRHKFRNNDSLKWGDEVSGFFLLNTMGFYKFFSFVETSIFGNYLIM